MCQMHPDSDVQLWNSDSTHQKWIKFAFIVTCFIFSIILRFGQRELESDVESIHFRPKYRHTPKSLRPKLVFWFRAQMRFRFDRFVPKSLPEIKLKQKYGEIHKIIENSYILLGLILKVSLFQNVFLIFLNFPKNQRKIW